MRGCGHEYTRRRDVEGGREGVSCGGQWRGCSNEFKMWREGVVVTKTV